jgi:hypothetical protein
MILLISASRVARIIDESQQCPATVIFSMKKSCTAILKCFVLMKIT